MKSSPGEDMAAAANAEFLNQDTGGIPADFDLDDFDDEFDDDFEAEVAGEYELEDDEYARALLDMIDFKIEGLEALDGSDEDELDESGGSGVPDTTSGPDKSVATDANEAAGN